MANPEDIDLVIHDDDDELVANAHIVLVVMVDETVLPAILLDLPVEPLPRLRAAGDIQRWATELAEDMTPFIRETVHEAVVRLGMSVTDPHPPPSAAEPPRARAYWLYLKDDFCLYLAPSRCAHAVKEVCVSEGEVRRHLHHPPNRPVRFTQIDRSFPQLLALLSGAPSPDVGGPPS